MQLGFGYGNGVQTVELPQENLLGVLHAAPIEHERRGPDAVSWALAHPIGSAPLHQLARPGQRIAIVTSDITRPLPSYQILPGVLDELYRAGVRPEDITVVLALGSHRKHTPEEVIRLVGRECYETVRCIDSDAADCIRLGDTAHGTPVDITRAVAEADFRICLGNIEFHYFAGYSGGAPKDANLYQTQKALDAAFRKYGPSATVLAMPHGGSTLPYLQDAGPDHSRT